MLKYGSSGSSFMQISEILISAGKISKEKRDNSWFPYKTNGCIEKNGQTLKLRWVKCNKDLGINPGGASSHLKSRHGINLNGSPSTNVEKTTPKSATIPTAHGTLGTHRPDASKMFYDINSDKPQVAGPRTSWYESDRKNTIVNLLTSPRPREDWVEVYREREKKQLEELFVETERKLGIAKKIREAEDAGDISVNDAKEMRLKLGLVPNEHRRLTAEVRDAFLKIANDPSQHEILRNYATSMLLTE